MLGLPSPASLDRGSRLLWADLGLPLPAPAGERLGSSGLGVGSELQLLASSWPCRYHLGRPPGSRRPPVQEEEGWAGQMAPRAESCVCCQEWWGKVWGPPPSSPCGLGLGLVLVEGEGSGVLWILTAQKAQCVKKKKNKKNVDTIAMVGNPHWISIRTMGKYLKERKYIYI